MISDVAVLTLYSINLNEQSDVKAYILRTQSAIVLTVSCNVISYMDFVLFKVQVTSHINIAAHLADLMDFHSLGAQYNSKY